MEAHIIYRNYLMPNGIGMSIGGIQTYLTNLSHVLIKEGYHVSIYQRGDKDFHTIIDENIEVFGYERPEDKVRGRAQMLYDKAKSRINPSNGDILIFGCESMAVKTDGRVPVIGIQHGISWDIPQDGLSSGRWNFLYFKKQYQAWRTALRIKRIDKLICVDCNFINWYKALVPHPEVEMYYIPNFSALPEERVEKSGSDSGINIIFARRFEPQRGTRLFMNVAKRLLDEYDKIRITIAGDGSDEKLLKENLESNPHVRFIRYQSDESLSIHADKHIAVVPTLGSEGTSLSLLEAMASGCAVVCTNVGGMTNIVINGYNGLMVAPEEDDLYHAMKTLIDNDNLRKALANRGYESIESSFSLSRWQERWRAILQSK